jgi:glutathione peroxidase
MTTTDLASIPFATSDGETTSLAAHGGKVVLVVNVASKCGLTPQYEALQALYRQHQSDGFTVLGFPANDFLGQEPGTDTEIAEFCSTTYAVTFPVLAKISVVGDARHPLYTELTKQVPVAEGKAAFRDRLAAGGIETTQDPDVLWNFEKFLIGRGGDVVARFAPSVSPDAPQVLAAIRSELGR